MSQVTQVTVLGGILNSPVGAEIVYELSVMSASRWSAGDTTLILKLVTGRPVRFTTIGQNPRCTLNMNSVFSRGTLIDLPGIEPWS
jgi:hypothetical protein